MPPLALAESGRGVQGLHGVNSDGSLDKARVKLNEKKRSCALLLARRKTARE
jgi:hypothetical protein